MRILPTDPQTICSFVRKMYFLNNKPISAKTLRSCSRRRRKRRRRQYSYLETKKSMRAVQMELKRKLKTAKNKPTTKGNPTNKFQQDNAKEVLRI